MNMILKDSKTILLHYYITTLHGRKKSTCHRKSKGLR